MINTSYSLLLQSGLVEDPTLALAAPYHLHSNEDNRLQS